MFSSSIQLIIDIYRYGTPSLTYILPKFNHNKAVGLWGGIPCISI